MTHRCVFLCLVSVAFGPVFVGCASRVAIDRSSACAMLDSLYSTSGFEAPIRMAGKATIDANQQRIRGKFTLHAKPSGDVVLEFTSSLLFGSRREDFLFSLVDDTLRVLDRERGMYYEGDDAEEFVKHSLEMEFGVRDALVLALGKHPPCESMERIDYKAGSGGEVRFSGRTANGSFRVVFAAQDKRLQQVIWPVALDHGTMDHLEVEYRWSADDSGRPRLEGVTMRLEKREWRCRLHSASG